ncbi:hypothetical protein [Ktedonobacter robiniae]|uniref:Transposase n=1 Tax=Ktedonobacter robiniae TaxID=2778365 RepID=A0ABQ3UZ82_9CHLR|nr:hypothetical protein [Ktedonobacter robiniae]GHO58196.1 hypothetical protein KSB_66710 [Ktedonobacter robiniae]
MVLKNEDLRSVNSIDPGKPWQNYAETLFSIQKRLADHAFSNARNWAEIQQAHQTWWNNYNKEITEVKSACRLETHFRSPQMDLWQLSDTEWLLALRRPEPSPRKKVSKITAFAQQLPLPLFGATG